VQMNVHPPPITLRRPEAPSYSLFFGHRKYELSFLKDEARSCDRAALRTLSAQVYYWPVCDVCQV